MRARTGWALAALIVAIVPGVAAAKDERPAETAEPAPHARYAHSLAEAMAEAKERSCLVLVTVHKDG